MTRKPAIMFSENIPSWRSVSASQELRIGSNYREGNSIVNYTLIGKVHGAQGLFRILWLHQS